MLPRDNPGQGGRGPQQRWLHAPKMRFTAAHRIVQAAHKAASQPWPGGGLFTFPEGVLPVNSTACTTLRAARSSCVQMIGWASPGPSSQTPAAYYSVYSFTHSFIHSFILFFTPSFIPWVFARHCARHWGYGGKQDIILMTVQDWKPHRTVRH